jgi:hypothetical protein
MPFSPLDRIDGRTGPGSNCSFAGGPGAGLCHDVETGIDIKSQSCQSP